MIEISFGMSYFEMIDMAYSRIQLPLQNVFALTVHKTQGLSLQNVTISFDSDMFCAGQAYTALSRAQRLQDVSIASLNWSAFKVDRSSVEEYDRLKSLEL